MGRSRRVPSTGWRPAASSAGYDALAFAGALLVLGPVLAPGLLFTYDLVWVPDLAVTSAGWGLVDGLPRAVPSDQVVAILDELVPGAWLQKVILVGALTGAGAGFHRLVRSAPPAARGLAALIAVWNPFVAERLLIGHWPLLLAYATLPWIILAGRGATERRALPAQLPILVVIGSLSASAGVLTAIAVAVFVGWSSKQSRVVLSALVAAVNAPWVVAGMMSGNAARADSAVARIAAEAFAAHGRDGVPTLVVVLGGGGIWNSQTAAPYDPVRAWLWALLLSTGVVTLLVVLVRCRGSADSERRERIAALVLAVAGLLLALQSALFPAAGAFLAVHVPGGGLFRDSTRAVALVFPAAVLGLAVLTHRLLSSTGRTPVAATTTSIVGALVPIALLPGLLGGAGGDLRAVALPPAYAELAATLDAQAAPGSDPVRVLSLPYSAYRAPAWNHGRPVLDPVPRLVGDVEVVASDDLYVSGRLVSGEDSRRAEVLAALGEVDPRARSAALRALGITHVVRASGPDVDTAPAEIAPTLAGQEVASADRLSVLRLDGAVARPANPTPPPVRGALAAAWAAFFGAALAPLVRGALSVVRRWRRSRV